MKSIGAGGGSIVWIDPGGLLRVGPQSAGADPGPACYGHGGTDATITDAAVVLGWIDPDYFLGGRLPLDAEAAFAAVERAVAAPLGLSVHEAAYAALTIASENIVGAIREITIAQGIDPREVTMVAGGGASGLNVVPIARELGCRRVLLPSMASALSACGALFADIVSEFSRSRYEETRSLDREAVNDALADVEERADGFLAGLAGLPVTADAQGLPRRGPVPRPGVGARRAGAAPARVGRGRARRSRRPSTRRTSASSPCGSRDSTWSACSGRCGRRPCSTSRSCGRDSRRRPAPTGEVEAYFKETGLATVPRYDGPSLPRRNPDRGARDPARADDDGRRLPGSSAVVTQHGNYLLELAPERAESTSVAEEALAR